MIDRRPFHRQLALALAYVAYVVLFCATVAGMASAFGVGGHLAARLAITAGLLIAVAVLIVAVGNALGASRIRRAPQVACLAVVCLTAPVAGSAVGAMAGTSVTLSVVVMALVQAFVTVAAFDSIAAGAIDRAAEGRR